MNTEQALFDVPNLDDLSIDPADYDRAAQVFDALARYASLKASAMRTRLAGRINPALRMEERLEEIYASLPEWARW
jgi:hypothetical protein